MPNRPLVSGTNQWNQWTYATLYGMNWNSGEQGLIILDNDDVWMFATRTGFYPASEEIYDFWLGLVKPSGVIRHNGDVYSFPPGNDSVYRDLWNTDRPPMADETGNVLVTSGNLIDYSWGELSDGGFCITDGQYIYVWSPYVKLWYKIDPASLTFELMAGIHNTTGSTDSHIGTLATFTLVSGAKYHDGYIYFWDRVPGIGLIRYFLRKMSVTSPYSVETVAFRSPPSGFNDGWSTAVAYSWAGTINGSTGTYNGFNPDAVFMGPFSSAIYDGYLYFMGQHLTYLDGYTSIVVFDSLRRYPLSGGDVETLYYGMSVNGGTLANPPRYRDAMCDYADTPGGVWTGSYWNDRSASRGTPELEGWDPWWEYNMEISYDGTLFTANDSGSDFYGGWQFIGGRITAFDIKSLVARANANGPIRHNREEPFYKTIAGATTLDESNSTWNSNVRDRVWWHRDGNVPLYAHSSMPGLALNNNSPKWKGKLLYPTSSTDNVISNSEYWGPHTHHIKVLESGTNTTSGPSKRVSLVFEGRSLKGYANTADLKAPFAEKEVFLG